MAKAKHKCEQCDFKAKSAGGLKTHMRAKHDPSNRHEHFDLNIDTKEKAIELVGHMTNLKLNAGWQVMCQIFKGNISVMEDMIIAKEDSEGHPLTEEQVDKLRERRNIMKEMIDKPQWLIDQFNMQQGLNVPTYDPYAVDVEQFGKPHKGAPTASPLQ